MPEKARRSRARKTTAGMLELEPVEGPAATLGGLMIAADELRKGNGKT
jgi:hypothetical protein